MITNQQLIEHGYRPLEVVILYDAGVVIRTPGKEEPPWWTEDITRGKIFAVMTTGVNDLADIFGKETRLPEDSTSRGCSRCMPRPEFESPLFIAFLEEERDAALQALWGKIEHGVLHLAALFKDEATARCSSHGGNFAVVWSDCGAGEVLP